MNIPRFLLEGQTSYLQNANSEAQEQLLKDGQSPDVLWFGCSDSRVMPEQSWGRSVEAL